MIAVEHVELANLTGLCTIPIKTLIGSTKLVAESMGGTSSSACIDLYYRETVADSSHFIPLTSFRGLSVDGATAEVDRRAAKAKVFNLGLNVG